MHIVPDPSRVVENQDHDFDDLSAGSAGVLRFHLSEAAIDDQIVIIVTEELACALGVSHQHCDGLH